MLKLFPGLYFVIQLASVFSLAFVLWEIGKTGTVLGYLNVFYCSTNYNHFSMHSQVVCAGCYEDVNHASRGSFYFHPFVAI